MDFNYKLESIHTNSLSLDYFLVPWDTEILAQPVAEIKHIEVRDPEEAGIDYLAFIHWCEKHDISLCSCRLAHDRLVESMFLESQGFRFIELAYHPRLDNLQAMEFTEDTMIIEQAQDQDRETLAEMAATIFHHGRFHQDPRLGATVGNRRYRTWLLNSFEHPNQEVFKCLLDGEIIAFFVVEYPEQGHCHWSLVGLAPGLQGRGLGKRAWRAMLAWHKENGFNTISTSISSHNSIVFNLNLSLGFQFSEPQITLHWRPTGSRSSG